MEPFELHVLLVCLLRSSSHYNFYVSPGIFLHILGSVCLSVRVSVCTCALQAELLGLCICQDQLTFLEASPDIYTESGLNILNAILSHQITNKFY